MPGPGPFRHGEQAARRQSWRGAPPRRPAARSPRCRVSRGRLDRRGMDFSSVWRSRRGASRIQASGSLRGCCGWMARGVPTRGVLASPGTAAACAGRPMGVGWEQRSRCIVKKGARPGREVRIRGAAACGGLQSGRASGDQAGSGLHGWASRSSGERSEVNRSHAATNRAAIAGPMTKPVSPNSAMPPRVEISTR